jgi:hypothetical protein
MRLVPRISEVSSVLQVGSVGSAERNEPSKIQIYLTAVL